MLGYKWLVAAACAGLLMASSQSCSMNEDRYSDDFRKALEKSGFLHEPLTVSEELSYENLTAKGKVIEATMPVKGSWELVLVNDTGRRRKREKKTLDLYDLMRFSIACGGNL